MACPCFSPKSTFPNSLSSSRACWVPFVLNLAAFRWRAGAGLYQRWSWRLGSFRSLLVPKCSRSFNWDILGTSPRACLPVGNGLYLTSSALYFLSDLAGRPGCCISRVVRPLNYCRMRYTSTRVYDFVINSVMWVCISYCSREWYSDTRVPRNRDLTDWYQSHARS